MIDIDGSLGEGGGAILRIATALSAVTSKPININNIRSKRPKPGLMPQHLYAVKAVADLCNAEVSGLEIGSTELSFHPSTIKAGNYKIDIKTAGSITLILQAFMIPAAFADGPVKITIIGGTDVRWSPSVDYLRYVTLPILKLMGYNADIELVRRGHYPRGGGILEVKIFPVSELIPINILKQHFNSINCISHAVKLPEHVAVRQANAAQKTLKRAGYDVNIEIEHSNNSLGPGSGIFLWTDGAVPVSGSSIGEPGKKAEDIGAEAANQILYHISKRAAIDRYMGDQIIPYLAIAGNSTINTAELTQHALTNIQITQRFIKRKINVSGKLGETAKITVE